MCAGFVVNTPVPYINLEKITTFLNHGHTAIQFPYIHFSDEVLTPAAYKFAASGLSEKTVSNASIKSAPADPGAVKFDSGEGVSSLPHVSAFRVGV